MTTTARGLSWQEQIDYAGRAKTTKRDRHELEFGANACSSQRWTRMQGQRYRANEPDSEVDGKRTRTDRARARSLDSSWPLVSSHFATANMPAKPVDAMAFLRPYKRDGKPSNGASTAPRAPSTPQKRPRPPQPPKDDDDDLAKPRPKGTYREYKLVSTSLDNWKYDVFKFDSRKPVDLGAWAQPLKLNRKHAAAREGEDTVSKGPITPMLGLDGKPVIGPDGSMVMMQDGRPVRPKKEEDDEDEAPKPATPAAKKRKPFQKKTRQIHTIPEEQRQLQRDERYPWLLEDKAGQETWVGRIENADKATMYGLFLTSTSTEFYFIPAHRWYKMQKRPNHKTASMEEVEAEVTYICAMPRVAGLTTVAVRAPAKEPHTRVLAQAPTAVAAGRRRGRGAGPPHQPRPHPPPALARALVRRAEHGRGRAPAEDGRQGRPEPLW